MVEIWCEESDIIYGELGKFLKFCFYDIVNCLVNYRGNLEVFV